MFVSNKPVFFKSTYIPPPPPVPTRNNQYSRIFKQAAAEVGSFCQSPLPPPSSHLAVQSPGYHSPSVQAGASPHFLNDVYSAPSLGSHPAHCQIQTMYPYANNLPPQYYPSNQLANSKPDKCSSPVKTIAIPPPPKHSPEHAAGKYVSYHNNNFNNYYITTPGPFYSASRECFSSAIHQPGFYQQPEDRVYYEPAEGQIAADDAAADTGSAAKGNPFLNPAAHYPSSRRKIPPRLTPTNSRLPRSEPSGNSSEHTPGYYYIHSPPAASSYDQLSANAASSVVKSPGRGYPAHYNGPYSHSSSTASEMSYYYRQPLKTSNTAPGGLETAKQTYASAHAPFAAAGPKKLFSPYARVPSRMLRPGRRRPRKMFTDAEVNNLIYGVEQFGEGKWARILQCFEFEDRTAVDLKDKWRNLQKPSSTVKVPRHRRTRLPYSEIECRMLRHGVQLFGHNWVEILRAFSFHSERTPVDLKDKWRNLQIKSGLIHPPHKRERRFLLLDADNTVFRNVYPRDAALKAAARGVEYIKLLQVGTPRIHVFAGERRLVHRYVGQERGAVWKGRVQKLGMERATVAQLRVAKARFATEFGVKDAYEIAPNVKIEMADAIKRPPDRVKYDGGIKYEGTKYGGVKFEGAGWGEDCRVKEEEEGISVGDENCDDGVAVRFKMDRDACYWQKN